MPTPTRSNFQREQDLLRTAGWYLQGWTQRKIADALGVTQQQVSYDLQQIRAEWKERTALALDEHKTCELAKIDNMESGYWQQWQNSIDTSEHKSGYVGYLDGVQWCIEQRCKILGLYAPTQTRNENSTFFTPENAQAAMERVKAILEDQTGTGQKDCERKETESV